MCSLACTDISDHYTDRLRYLCRLLYRGEIQVIKKFWVLGWDTYYPSADNFRASFETVEEAHDYIDRVESDDNFYPFDNYRIINIEDRL